MARCAGGVDFQSTPWNQSLGEGQAAFFVRETSTFTGEGDSFDFETVLAEVDQMSVSCKNAPQEGVLPGNGVKFTLVMGNEYGDKDTYSATPRPGEVTHLSLSEALASRVMPEAADRIARTNVRFQNTVLTLLKIVRPLSLN